jgi:glycosyltransferase involved in cell wall biosynthesis
MTKIRVLQVVKTSDGAPWAARQARILRDLGAEVHVALPTSAGAAVADWVRSGAEIHIVDLNLPVRSPWRLPRVLSSARQLVSRVRPDLIHSHFVTTTCTMRLALGKSHSIPRLYQVAGPLHLEHWPSRTFELSLAGDADYWIPSSRCILDTYLRLGIPAQRLFLSYYGWFDAGEDVESHKGELRALVDASANDVVVGNVNFMYPPKYYLGQTVGLKGHETIIDALGLVIPTQRDVLGVFVGGAWGGATDYETRLRERGAARAAERIRFTGALPFSKARRMWEDFDLGIHVPLSENVGGVPEPLFHGVPVIAGNVGGLPEVVLPGRTGYLVPIRQPGALATTTRQVLRELDHARSLAKLGQQLVRTMFDAVRTGGEIFEIYRSLLGLQRHLSPPFSSERFVASTDGSIVQ